jgi:hypothetical protein
MQSDKQNPWNLTPNSYAHSALSAGANLGPAAAQVQIWLQICDTEHKESCAKSALPPILPTRILDIGSTNDPIIVLFEPRGATAAYICLSYCWGAAEFYKTTAENIESNKTQIAARDLPSAFNLAIQLVRALGIRYLWIDALCIIQNDENDWQREASKMADIYSNCLMTISLATLSSPCETYKLKDERKHILNSVEVHMRVHFSYRTTSKTGLYFPLSARAWAFQERVLSPKVVHLGPHELFWDCQKESTCECSLRKYELLPKNAYHTLVMGRLITSNLEERVQKLWWSIVEEYSSRVLSFSSDKLLALSGVAESVRRLRKDDYLAGLWSSTLVSDLCWNRERTKDKPVWTGRSQDSTWRAPSWSWACVDNKIWFGWTDFYEPLCTVLNYHITQDGPSFTGKVRSGWIMLKTALMSCSIDTQGQNLLFDFDCSKSYNFFPDGIEDCGKGQFFTALLAKDMGADYMIVVRLLEGHEQGTD